MRHVTQITGFALFFCLATIPTAQGKQLRKVQEGKRHVDSLQTTVCEVASTPASFDGKLIEVRGSVFAGLETNILYDEACKDKNGLPARILFTERDTSKGVQSDRQPNEETEYRRFWNLVGIHKQSKSKSHSMLPNKYTVTATLIGRYEVLEPSVPSTRFPGRGRLVLSSVHDVVARDFETVF